jgi:hypothetical protein
MWILYEKKYICDFDRKVAKYVKIYVLWYHIFFRPFLKCVP